MTIRVITPQFEREPGAVTPAAPPTDWDALLELSVTALRELGCRAWNDPDDTDDQDLKPAIGVGFNGCVLMLFPGEWYASIPRGFIVTNIFGKSKPFEPGKTDNDIRFGCLPYGVTVPVKSPEDLNAAQVSR